MAIVEETQRMMLNWAEWRLSGGSASMSVTTAYDLEARGRCMEMPIPMLNGEASDVEAGVRLLPEPLKLVIFVYWLDCDLDGKEVGRRATITKRARICRCAIGTLYRRLDHAHARIHLHRQALRRRSQHVADVLTRCQTPLPG